MWVRGLKLGMPKCFANKKPVAPYVGAWIETGILGSTEQEIILSHPMWVRGLKQKKSFYEQKYNASHPMWVRGLKLQIISI